MKPCRLSDSDRSKDGFSHPLFGFLPRHLAPVAKPVSNMNASISLSSASIALRSDLASSVSLPLQKTS